MYQVPLMKDLAIVPVRSFRLKVGIALQFWLHSRHDPTFRLHYPLVGWSHLQVLYGGKGSLQMVCLANGGYAMMPRFLSTQDPARGLTISQSPGRNLFSMGVMRQEVVLMGQFERA